MQPGVRGSAARDLPSDLRLGAVLDRVQRHRGHLRDRPGDRLGRIVPQRAGAQLRVLPGGYDGRNVRRGHRRVREQLERLRKRLPRVHGECAPVLCVTNGDCPSDICNWGVCLARPLAEGSGCSTDAACASDACTLGSCRECDRDDQCVSSQHCNLVGDCVADLGNNAVCTSNAECLSGICSVGFCAECVQDSQCPSSEHCNLFGDCVDDLGLGSPCTSNAECRSGKCIAVCVL